jgi:hypothetical protein
MDDPAIDEAAIRAYLLGRIGPEEEISVQVDERMLADPEFSLLTDLIEDEILEEYVDGVLTAADIEAVEGHFLVPPERQLKLRRMHLISRRVAGLAAGKDTSHAEAQDRAGSPSHWRAVIFPSVRTWAEIAAGLTLVSCAIYFWNQQRELRLAVNPSRQELALSKQVQTGTLTVMQEGAATLNLVVPGLSRGDQRLPEAHLTSGAATLRVSVALSPHYVNRLSVRLQQGDTVVWSRDGMEASPVAGGAVLSLDIPTSVVPEGSCRLIVSAPGRGEISFWFNATKPR